MLTLMSRFHVFSIPPRSFRALNSSTDIILEKHKLIGSTVQEVSNIVLSDYYTMIYDKAGLSGVWNSSIKDKQAQISHKLYTLNESLKITQEIDSFLEKFAIPNTIDPKIVRFNRRKEPFAENIEKYLKPLKFLKYNDEIIHTINMIWKYLYKKKSHQQALHQQGLYQKLIYNFFLKSDGESFYNILSAIRDYNHSDYSAVGILIASERNIRIKEYDKIIEDIRDHAEILQFRKNLSERFSQKRTLLLSSDSKESFFLNNLQCFNDKEFPPFDFTLFKVFPEEFSKCLMNVNKIIKLNDALFWIKGVEESTNLSQDPIYHKISSEIESIYVKNAIIILAQIYRIGWIKWINLN